jgi:hypothetical protein
MGCGGDAKRWHAFPQGQKYELSVTENAQVG